MDLIAHNGFTRPLCFVHCGLCMGLHGHKEPVTARFVTD